MKRILLSILLTGCIAGGFAQKKDTVLVVTRDTSGIDTAKNKKSKTFSVTIKTKPDSVKKAEKKPSSKFTLGLTLSRIDIGLSRNIDNGSFNLSTDNSYLETKKATNFGFEFLQAGYRFNSNFKIYLSAGLDWTHMYLEKNITFAADKPLQNYTTETIDFSKNRFSSRYLRVPLNFQIRSNDNKQGKKFQFVAGPEIGFLLNGKQKQVSAENGKEKTKDDFNFEQLRYGAFARLGYGNFGIYSKYYFNDMFVSGKGPADLNNMSFGVMIGF